MYVPHCMYLGIPSLSRMPLSTASTSSIKLEYTQSNKSSTMLSSLARPKCWESKFRLTKQFGVNDKIKSTHKPAKPSVNIKVKTLQPYVIRGKYKISHFEMNDM